MNSTTLPSWILERYISPWVLPKEKIIGWVKWQPHVKFNHLIIRTEADVELYRLLNVNERVFNTHQPSSGLFKITSDNIQVKGFVGFEACYNAIPESERELGFVIEFVFDDQRREEVELVTEVIRPIISIKQATREIASTKEKPSPEVINILLENVGRGDGRDLSSYIETVKGKDLQIRIEPFEEPYDLEQRLFVKSNKMVGSKIIINGVGYGMIQLGFEYKDRIGNHYKTPVTEIIVNIEEGKRIEVPIRSGIKGAESVLSLEPILA
jgi:hypothetical protein